MRGPVKQKVIDLLKENPDLRIPDLVGILGVSRQRVYQIINSVGVYPKGYGFYNPDIRRPPSPPPVPRIKTSVVVGPVSHTAAGTVAELIVAADMTARGWFVFFPLVRNARCDLIGLSKDGATIVRIEVRSGCRKNGKITFARKNQLAADYYGIVVTGEPVFYEPDLPAN